MWRATFQTRTLDVNARTEKSGLLDDARALVRLREELATEEERLAERRMDLARRYMEEPRSEPVSVPNEEWATWFEAQEHGVGA